MAITLENVGIAVRDIEATIAFFTDLGLTVQGRDTISGEWADTAVGLDGNHAKIAILQTPDGRGQLELFEYIHPDAIETEPTQPNEIGMPLSSRKSPSWTMGCLRFSLLTPILRRPFSTTLPSASVVSGSGRGVSKKKFVTS